MRHVRAGVFAAVLLVGSTGCRHRTAVAAASTTQSASPGTIRSVASASAAGKRRDGKTFEDAAHGFATTYPASWSSRPLDSENVLSVAGPGGAELDIAAPKLPAHVPGIIPLPAVQSGYVDDVRQRLSDVAVTETTPIRVAGAAARRFALTGRDNAGRPRKLLVIAIVKGDHLYIVTGESPADRYDAVKDAVEQVAASWEWTR